MDGQEHIQRGDGRARAGPDAHRAPRELGVPELPRTGSSATRWPIVVRPLDAPALQTLADTMRRKTGVEIIDKRGALRPVLEALRRGRMIGILLDQNATRREGVFVPFFGRAASTSRSIALLALRTRTPIVPIFIRREGPGRHRVVVEPPMPMTDPANDCERAVVELTAAMHRSDRARCPSDSRAVAVGPRPLADPPARRRLAVIRAASWPSSSWPPVSPRPWTSTWSHTARPDAPEPSGRSPGECSPSPHDRMRPAGPSSARRSPCSPARRGSWPGSRA